MILQIITGLTNAINEYAPKLRGAALALGVAIMDGITGGMASKIGGVLENAKRHANSILNVMSGPLALAVNSPSKKTIPFGEALMEGLAVGMGKDSTAVAAAKRSANNVVDTFAQVSRGMATVMNDLDAVNPTISPVLDLSGVEREANRLGQILTPTSLAAGVSIGRAQAISDATRPGFDGTGGIVGSHGPREIKFEQNITAPTELSTGELYRQTKTQINLAKKELELL
jgi:hypothetical protein